MIVANGHYKRWFSCLKFHRPTEIAVKNNKSKSDKTKQQEMVVKKLSKFRIHAHRGIEPHIRVKLYVVENRQTLKKFNWTEKLLRKSYGHLFLSIYFNYCPNEREKEKKLIWPKERERKTLSVVLQFGQTATETEKCSQNTRDRKSVKEWETFHEL